MSRKNSAGFELVENFNYDDMRGLFNFVKKAFIVHGQIQLTISKDMMKYMRYLRCRRSIIHLGLRIPGDDWKYLRGILKTPSEAKINRQVRVTVPSKLVGYSSKENPWVMIWIHPDIPRVDED